MRHAEKAGIETLTNLFLARLADFHYIKDMQSKTHLYCTECDERYVSHLSPQAGEQTNNQQAERCGTVRMEEFQTLVKMTLLYDSGLKRIT